MCSSLFDFNPRTQVFVEEQRLVKEVFEVQRLTAFTKLARSHIAEVPPSNNASEAGVCSIGEADLFVGVRMRDETGQKLQDASM